MPTSPSENSPEEYPGWQPPSYPGYPPPGYPPPVGPPPGYPPPWQGGSYYGGDPNLDAIVAEYVSHGARVEARSPTQAVLVFGHRINNLAHGLLSLVTCGGWLLVWVIIAIFGGERRVTVTSHSRYQNPYRARNIALLCLGGLYAMAVLFSCVNSHHHSTTTPDQQQITSMQP